MIDLEKLRESAELFKSKDLQMGVNPEALLELLDHITKLEASETKLITERDHCEEVIDRMADAVLGPDRHEWTSAYDIDDAAEEVEQRAAQLEKENASLKQERAELACAAMEAVDMLWDDDNEGAYEHLVENFEDIYNET